MAALGARTKKVTTYGKKKSQIISIHSDFNTAHPASPSSPLPLPLPQAIKRPPLASKLSSDITNIPLTPLAPRSSKSKTKTKAKVALLDTPPSSPEFVVTKVRKVTRPGRAVIVPRSPSISPIKTRVNDRGVAKREVLDAVVVPSLRKSRPQTKSKLSQNLLERFADISIHEEREEDEGALPSSGLDETTAPPTPAESLDVEDASLSALLGACNDTSIIPFATFLESSILPQSSSIRKVGEASYSEVFGISPSHPSKTIEEQEMVLKIIPLLPACIHEDSRIPDCSSIGDVVKEIGITKKMSELPGFVKFLGAYAVQGAYPSRLLDEWDSYKSTLGSASARPSAFNSSQKYALVVLSNAGVDLEAFKFDTSRGWIQAAGVFWQVADALGRAEQWTRFEHRDLHEGQILLSPQLISSKKENENYLCHSYTGIKSTIIDFGLSRLDLDVEDGVSQKVVYTLLPEEVFQGKGKQWDLYRSMRDRIGVDSDSDRWDDFHPITNVMWLRYILQYILENKSLKKPTSTSNFNTKRRPTAAAVAVAEEQERAYNMLIQLEHVLSTSLAPQEQQGTTRTRSKRGAAAAVFSTGVSVPVDGLKSAGDLVNWGKEVGWIA